MNLQPQDDRSALHEALNRLKRVRPEGATIHAHLLSGRLKYHFRKPPPGTDINNITHDVVFNAVRRDITGLSGMGADRLTYVLSHEGAHVVQDFNMPCLSNYGRFYAARDPEAFLRSPDSIFPVPEHFVGSRSIKELMAFTEQAYICLMLASLDDTRPLEILEEQMGIRSGSVRWALGERYSQRSFRSDDCKSFFMGLFYQLRFEYIAQKVKHIALLRLQQIIERMERGDLPPIPAHRFVLLDEESLFCIGDGVGANALRGSPSTDLAQDIKITRAPFLQSDDPDIRRLTVQYSRALGVPEDTNRLLTLSRALHRDPSGWLPPEPGQ